MLTFIGLLTIFLSIDVFFFCYFVYINPSSAQLLLFSFLNKTTIKPIYEWNIYNQQPHVQWNKMNSHNDSPQATSASAASTASAPIKHKQW